MFFVASRGHHADIGYQKIKTVLSCTSLHIFLFPYSSCSGVTPGSMPPHSRTLEEEGAVFTRYCELYGCFKNIKNFQKKYSWIFLNSAPKN